VPRLLLIVSRRQPDLYPYLVRQFASEADVQVMLDRRIAQRRQPVEVAPSTPEADERRRAERRRNTDATYQLLTMGYAFVRTEGAGA
jgi:hypothetical protein